MPVPEDVALTFPDDGGCFGCSPTNAAGLQLRFRRLGDRRVVRSLGKFFLRGTEPVAP